jgi:prevent-host-death family protein
VFVHSTNHKGAVAEAAIVYEATKLGVEVFIPLSDHCRYDLVFGMGSRLYRVQCKNARRRDEVLIIGLISNWHTPHGYVRNRCSPDEIDLVAAYSPELERCFLLRFDSLVGKSGIQLRLSPPRNAQRAAVHYAADYEFPGAIAQLGERVLGMHEVAGSSPAGSTSSTHDREEVVGAHDFRCQFGYWMERAAAGEEILITRHGRRSARLGPADPRLDLETDQEDPSQ